MVPAKWMPGTVVLSHQLVWTGRRLCPVTLTPSAVAHGNLAVTVQTTPVVSQPNAFAQGSTVVAEKADITIRQDGGALMMLEGSAKLADVVKALNSLGATAQDLIAILQALKAAGSLRAELEII